MAKIQQFLTYKCRYCKKDIPITPDNFNKIVYRNKAYYHLDCYLHYLNEKISSLKTTRTKDKWINERDDLLNGNDYETFSVLKENYYKDQVYKFILQNYSISIVPKYIFVKLDSIYYGTFKGMNGTRIDPEDLLYMWNKMMPKLIAIYQRNIAKGKSMDEVGRINYDLAILVGKYDSYKKWKEKQNLLSETENKDVMVDTEYNIAKYDRIAESDTNSNEINISNVVDDIFGDDE